MVYDSHNALATKSAYFMTAIDGAFCVGRACDKQTRDVSIVMLDWSVIMGGYKTPAVTVVRDKEDEVGREIALSSRSVPTSSQAINDNNDQRRRAELGSTE